MDFDLTPVLVIGAEKERSKSPSMFSGRPTDCDLLDLQRLIMSIEHLLQIVHFALGAQKIRGDRVLRKVVVGYLTYDFPRFGVALEGKIDQRFENRGGRVQEQAVQP
jgi:hypothetical protein